jgi:hypothetical protein
MTYEQGREVQTYGVHYINYPLVFSLKTMMCVNDVQSMMKLIAWAFNYSSRSSQSLTNCEIFFLNSQFICNL